MENKLRLNRQKIITWILNAIIVILCFLLIMTASVTIESLYDTFSMPIDEDAFYNRIKYEEYYYMPSYYHQNTQAGFEGNAAMKEYYGIAKYYEAASLYKAYDTVGNTEQAQKYKELYLEMKNTL